jgi:hypothetical protein
VWNENLLVVIMMVQKSTRILFISEEYYWKQTIIKGLFLLFDFVLKNLLVQ